MGCLGVCVCGPVFFVCVCNNWTANGTGRDVDKRAAAKMGQPAQAAAKKKALMDRKQSQFFRQALLSLQKLAIQNQKNLLPPL